MMRGRPWKRDVKTGEPWTSVQQMSMATMARAIWLLCLRVTIDLEETCR